MIFNYFFTVIDFSSELSKIMVFINNSNVSIHYIYRSNMYLKLYRFYLKI